MKPILLFLIYLVNLFYSHCQNSYFRKVTSSYSFSYKKYAGRGTINYTYVIVSAVNLI